MSDNILFKVIDFVLIIKLTGKLDFLNAEELVSEVKKFKKCGKVILDCRELEYLNSTLLGAFYKISTCRDVVLVHDKNDFVSKITTILKLDKVIKCYGSLAEAMAMMGLDYETSKDY